MPTAKDYAAFIEALEDPAECPSEVAYYLAELLGHAHHLVHRALVAVNPPLVRVAERYHLLPESLCAVGAKVSELLLGDALGALESGS